MTNTTNRRRPRKMARESHAYWSDAGDEIATGALGPKAPSKTSQVLDLLRRPEGVTLAQLVEATVWLPHTTRAALTGLRKKGHAIIKSKVDDTTRYSIEPAACG
jgi:hypothetical protein